MTPAEDKGKVRLEELERWLGKSVGDAYAAALAIDAPAGSSPAWEAILAAHGAKSSSAEERQRVALATGMLRGAPADELYAVLQDIARDADARLKAISLPDDNTLELRWRRIQGVIGRVRDETLAAYRKQVIPKRSMFGAAKASAAAARGGPSATAVKSESFVMRCNQCGAPRLKNDVFVCEYCETPYA
jgi:hypothetical protein